MKRKETEVQYMMLYLAASGSLGSGRRFALKTGRDSYWRRRQTAKNRVSTGAPGSTFLFGYRRWFLVDKLATLYRCK